MNYSITYHEYGRQDLPVRPEVQITGRNRDGETTVDLIWSIQDDRDVKFTIFDCNAVETAIKLLEAWLRAEAHWDDRHSMRGVSRLWDHLEEVEESDILAEQIGQHHSLTSGFAF